MQDFIEKKKLSVLKILNENQKPLSSLRIRKMLEKYGYEISERTIRLYLLTMDKEGYTIYHRKQGRTITEKGKTELSKARVVDKIGFLNTKIDRLTYRMKFDLEKREGTVIVNVSLIEKKIFKKIYPLIVKAYQSGYSMGQLITIFDSAEKIDEIYIPDGYVGIGTVCSITINGVLLNHGIPVRSRFGGLLEIQDGQPTRFVAIINYDGTSLDPLEIFIKSGLTNYKGVIESRNGAIGASFREMPNESRDKVVELANELEKIGLGGFMRIGYPGQDLCEIPVNEGCFGAIIIGGLNPIAVLEESGIRLESKTLSGLAEFKRFFNYKEIDRFIKKNC